MVTNVQFTELDFFRNKELLKTYLKAQDRYKDFDFSGSNFNVLLDVLAYNTQLNSYYVHSAFSEMFIDTALLRESLNSHAKELNYLPYSRKSSQSQVDVSFNVSDSPSFITIPRHTQFIGSCNGRTYTFYNEESATVYPSIINNRRSYVYRNLNIFEGKIINELFVIDNNHPKRFTLSSDNIDLDSIRVFVRDNVESTKETEFVTRSNLFDLKSDSKVFFIQPYLKHRYELDFGKDVFGYEPKHGNVVRVEFRTTSGEDANSIRKFQCAEKVGGYSASVIFATISDGGSERESTEDIRFFAPKSIQIQQRAVTENDYETLLKNRFSEIQAISVYGGEEADPPQFGRVVIAVDVTNQNGITNLQKNKFADFLRDKVPLAIEPFFVSPDFVWVEVISNVVYNTALTTKSSADINNTVKTAIINYSDESLNDFKRICRFSQLSKSIDNSDLEIISNDTKLRIIVDYTPIINNFESFTLKFANELINDHLIALSDQHTPAFESTFFTNYDGTSNCKLIDNGEGKIVLVSVLNNSYSVINNEMGTIDYSTGTVNIKKLNVMNFINNTMKFYATTKSKDIVCPIGRIIAIRDEDITLNVSGIRL